LATTCAAGVESGKGNDSTRIDLNPFVAEAIAEKLHQLGQISQVLCVTHQPLVAAMADRHFRVDKQVITEKTGDKENNGHPDQRTVVRVTSLDNLTKRREELAQLAGGKSAQEAIAFAESLLTQAANHRRQS
jgi:DNA repair protein RecN (Recombination protein N)